jgi:hypothetical protein
MRLGEPIPERKKVREFLNGITDPQCAKIKLNILANQVYMNDFAQAINYIASVIDLTIKNSNSSSRQLSDLNSRDGHRGRGPGHQGRNAGGQGRGGHGRNGTNRGRGRRGRGLSGQFISWQENENSINGNENQSLTRGYSCEEWQSLSQSDRNRVMRAREHLETARTVAALLRDQGDSQGVIYPHLPQLQLMQEVMQEQMVEISYNLSQVSLDNASQAMTRR